MLADFPIQSRGGKGIICHKDGISSAALVNNSDNLLIVGDKSSICISAKEINTLNRGSVGSKIIKGNKIISITKI